MPQTKEEETSCAEVYGFALFPSAVLLWAEQSPAPTGAIRPFLQGRGSAPPEVFPSSKELFI